MPEQNPIEKRASAIGEEALCFEGVARDAFIEIACRGDRELAKAIQRHIANPKQAFRSTLSTVVAAAGLRGRVQGFRARVLQNRYELRRRIGAGGMGQVFKAIDRRTGRPVAIKLIHPGHALGQDQRMRFVREARSAGGLHHPNIVEVYDIGQVEANLFMVMEYLEGLSLRALIVKRQHVPVRSMLRIMSQVSNAAGFAHSKGVFHGDIKPDNIMILCDGSAKLVDFGLAHLIGLPGSLVKGGGTPSYMAPERHQPPYEGPDERSDIWSLGITLFECLTGKPPFGTRAEIISSPTPVLTPHSPLAERLNLLLTRALAKRPEDRAFKAQSVANDLEGLSSELDLRHDGPSGTNAFQNSEAAIVPVAGPLRVATDSPSFLPNLGFSKAPEGEIQGKIRTLIWLKGRGTVE